MMFPSSWTALSQGLSLLIHSGIYFIKHLREPCLDYLAYSNRLSPPHTHSLYALALLYFLFSVHHFLKLYYLLSCLFTICASLTSITTKMQLLVGGRPAPRTAPRQPNYLLSGWKTSTTRNGIQAGGTACRTQWHL